jgi:hypothetical protein
MNNDEVKKLTNKIFKQKNMPAVKNFAAEFADGILFQALFNILYEERIDCRLVKSAVENDKLLNWNRINAQVCFNYLQQEFYLVSPTMKTLAKGKNETAIIKLIKVLINVSQKNIGDAKFLDDSAVKEIADVIDFEGTGSEQQQPTGTYDDLIGDVEFMGEKRSSKFDFILGSNTHNVAQ